MRKSKNRYFYHIRLPTSRCQLWLQPLVDSQPIRL